MFGREAWPPILIFAPIELGKLVFGDKCPTVSLSSLSMEMGVVFV